MRIEPLMHFGQFGNVQINELQQVVELDAGYSAQESVADGDDIVIPGPVMAAAEQEMVIIIACMNEEYRTIEGVLSGVPHGCLPILVSNSDRPGTGARPGGAVDRYETEVRLVETFCRRSRRSAIVIHQGDPGVATAFRKGGMSEIVDARTGLIYRGKGEAMIIGMAVAALTGRRYVGFVDADNFVPGSVTEYCKVFAAALHSARSPLAMVRVSWNSKPKVRGDRLVFDKKGRSSRVVNEWLNRLLQEYTGYGTDLIVTGNAGEHAMTMDLGLRLRLARGYAIEPYEIINILEQFGYAQGSPTAALAAAASTADHDSGHESDSSEMDIVTPASSQNSNLGLQQRSPSPSPSVASSSSLASRPSTAGLVEIMQVETRNPHFHDTTKGDEHVQDMQLQGLKAMYHSSVTPPALRAQLLRYMTENLGCSVDALSGEPPRERTYPPLAEALNFSAFADALGSHASDLRQIGHAAQLDVLLNERAFRGAGTHRPRRRKTRDHHHNHPQFQLQLQVPRRSDKYYDHGSPRSSSDGWETNL